MFTSRARRTHPKRKSSRDLTFFNLSINRLTEVEMEAAEEAVEAAEVEMEDAVAAG